jgi:hypothetical protein
VSGGAQLPAGGGADSGEEGAASDVVDFASPGTSSLDGTVRLTAVSTGPADDPEKLGGPVVQEPLVQGPGIRGPVSAYARDTSVRRHSAAVGAR